MRFACAIGLGGIGVMERLGWWLCAGLASLGLPVTVGAAEPPRAEVADPGDGHLASPAADALRESHITYPLEVDGWHAVGEHRFEDQSHGVCVRFVHGDDLDRWIDLYFYPAGALSPSQFAAAAREEADLIRQAHVQARHEAFDMGPLQAFAPVPQDGGGGLLPGRSLDLAYAVDGASYSSAMTLLLDRMHFIKARFSIRDEHLSRGATREQLELFTARLQQRVRIVAIGANQGPNMAAAVPPPLLIADRPGMRQIRLDYGVAGLLGAREPAAQASQAQSG
ncbi:hypothetical protein [Cognatiluteimonas telluris]|uniref:hypothetical protein n=1 Tax=Cognatiluteimonas telluris TaxID=1104775 RepID=UPI00140BB423|nr:hypothetical protein [Lysobacter telluris]